ncbi:hypothetical protein R2F61_04060 [Mollicutes bacterium LVI A0078]|nr:hypothetical protein R2F61_04060 [Mollicutes bacterium LVI A0078]
MNEIERSVRLEFIDKLENNSNINFFIWLVSFGEGRVSNKYLKSIVKSRYALISGGFENNTLYQPSSVRNWSEELANSNLVLLNGNKLIKVKEGE